MKLNKVQLVNEWKGLWKSYSALFNLANVLQALSVTGLSVLGVINVYFAFKIVIGLAIFFGVLGFIGRFIKQDSLTTSSSTAETPSNDSSP